jgi:hypothetical protein
MNDAWQPGESMPFPCSRAHFSQAWLWAFAVKVLKSHRQVAVATEVSDRSMVFPWRSLSVSGRVCLDWTSIPGLLWSASESLGHRVGAVAAPADGGLLLFPDSSTKTSLGPAPENAALALGAARLAPFGRCAPKDIGTRKRRPESCTQIEYPLSAFLAKDAEVETTRNNSSFTVLSLATKRSWKNRESAERQSETTWHRVIARGKAGRVRDPSGQRSQAQGKSRMCFESSTADGDSGEAERGSGIGLKLRLHRGIAFTFVPDHCSGTSRIGVRNHPGIAFTFPPESPADSKRN